MWVDALFQTGSSCPLNDFFVESTLAIADMILDGIKAREGISYQHSLEV